MADNTKKPQDRKPSKEEVAEAQQQDFSEIEGSELLVPFSKVKGSDQARLVNRLKSLGLFSDDTDSEGGDDVAFQDLDLEAVADLIDYVSEKFAVDSGKFEDRKSTRLNSSHVAISYAVFCLKKKKLFNLM